MKTEAQASPSGLSQARTSGRMAATKARRRIMAVFEKYSQERGGRCTEAEVKNKNLEMPGGFLIYLLVGQWSSYHLFRISVMDCCCGETYSAGTLRAVRTGKL